MKVIALILSIVILYVYVKWNYRMATVQDEIDTVPIDYSREEYKEAEAFFRGIGRV